MINPKDTVISELKDFIREIELDQYDLISYESGHSVRTGSWHDWLEVSQILGRKIVISARNKTFGQELQVNDGE